MRTATMLGTLVTAAVLVLGACSSSDTPAVTSDCVAAATRTCTCAEGGSGSQRCSADGFWLACACITDCAVTPSCSGKTCGADDGCGNKCLTGSCPPDQSCVAGACKGACPGGPKCTGKACGAPDDCGGICTTVACPKAGYSCVATASDRAECQCKPVCTTCGGDDTCGGKCSTGTCNAGFKCSTGACAVDPASKWIITVTKGTLPTDPGSNSFSKPDAMVCLWIGGKRLCTQDSPDSLTPTWGCGFPAVSASTLMAGVDVEMFDNDRSATGSCGEALTAAPGEAICPKGTVAIGAANFASKTWGASCKTATGTVVMSFEATLTPM